MDNVDDIYPLSSVQEGILYHALREPRTGQYVQQITSRINGDLDVQRLRDAWDDAIRHHPSLRTSFHWKGVEQPLQVVRTAVELPWTVHDWRRLDTTLLEYRVERLLLNDRSKNFTMADAPLMRFTLLRTGEHEWRFIWTFHHILADGWSTALVLREVFSTYDENGESVPTAPPPYRQFIQFLQDRDRDGAEHFWREALSGVQGPTPLLAGRAQGLRTGPALQTEHIIPSERSEAARAFARNIQITPSALFQGLWAILLHLYSGETDITFGIAVSGRPPMLRGIDRTVGLFMNSLPLRVPLSELDRCKDVVQTAARTFAQLADHEHTPLVDVQRWSGLPAGRPLFESLLVFENYPSSDAPLCTSVQLSELHYREESNYPLAVLVVPEPAIRVLFVHDPTKYTRKEIERLGHQLEFVLQQIVDNPDAALGALSLMSKEAGTELLAHSGSLARNTPPCNSWVHLFNIQAALSPGNVALVCGDSTYTYSELDRRSNQLAHALTAAGVQTGTRVALCFERSAEFVVCMLAVHKAGGAYIPIDGTYPTKRIHAILDDATPTVLLHGPVFQNSDPHAPFVALLLDSTWSLLEGLPETPRAVDPDPNEIAYIIYTSGSTGTPRGVKITHSNVSYSTIARLRYYHNAPVGDFLMPSSFSFDSSVAGIYWTLCDGGTLHIPEEKHARDGERLCELLESQDITHLLCVPSLYQLLMELHPQPFPALHVAIVAGEACPPSLVDTHHRTMGTTRLFNEYGPSECTVWSTVYECSQVAASCTTVPIGRPIPGTAALILDPSNRPLPQGIPGELCIAGPGVCPGYLNMDEATTEKFVALPLLEQAYGRVYRTGDRARYNENWEIEYLGRTDGQLKIRGFRVEPGEIEAVLLRHHAVDAVAVTASPAGSNDRSSVSDDRLCRLLEALDPASAEALLQEAEGMAPTPTHGNSRANNANMQQDQRGTLLHARSNSQYSLSVRITNPAFIRPPRDAQREWIFGRAMRELEDDLAHLDTSARRFVAGSPRGFDEFDATDDPDDIMEDWQIPLMRAMATAVGETRGDILEIGFGRGISATFVQDHNVRSHTIIESNGHCINTHYRPWSERYTGRTVQLLHGTWQEKLNALGTFDGILFHAYPLNEEDFIENVVNSVTFAAHFFPHAAAHLKPGGVFTYLTTEIDSLSRGHQRAVFEHFTSATSSIMPVRVPENTRDSWWADSMVLVKATK